MKIAILTNHYIASEKQANIHYIYNILSKFHKVDWYTYPVSLSIFRRRNRYKVEALINGWRRQYHIFNLIPKYVISSSLIRIILSFDFNGSAIKSARYDVLIVEGVQPSYVYHKFAYDKLVLRMSDDLGYLDFFSDEAESFKIMADSADQIWAVLLSTIKRYDNAIYLPNPSVHTEVIKNNERIPEAVYVGSNKIDNHLLEKLADSGVVVHIYSEACSVAHKNIILHGLLPKKELIRAISMYKIGIIPFKQDSKNVHMEIPLKTYDYLAAGLHVVMISSSLSINTDIIKLARTHDQFIDLVWSLMDVELDYDSYEKKLKDRSIQWFEGSIQNQLAHL